MTIVDYNDLHKEEFRRLNLGWLDRYGLTESHDLEVLDDPRGTIIDRGGHLFVALENDKVIGTAGIAKINEEEYELVKMSVDENFHGKGIGKSLLESCINEARKRQGRKMLLFSNNQLVKAISLYEKFGFRHIPVTDSPFETANVKMEISLA